MFLIQICVMKLKMEQASMHYPNIAKTWTIFGQAGN